MAEAKAPSAAAPAWRSSADVRLTLAIVAILLLGAALRLHGLDRTSLWNDEAVSWHQARQPFRGMIQATANDSVLPLHNIVLYATIRLFGDSEVALRLPSAILGIANIYLIYRLGIVLWERLTGVFAAALLALSGFHLWYSQEARVYSLLALAATAFALTTVHFLSRPNWLRASLCAATGVVLLYSHVYGIFVWAGINAGTAVVLLTGADWIAVDGKMWLAANSFAGLSFVPWAPMLLGQARRVVRAFWIPFPTPRFLYHMSVSIAGGAAMLGCLALLVLLSFLHASAGDKGAGDVPAQPATRLPIGLPPFAFELGWQKIILLSWGATPLLLGYAISIASRPLLFDRYLIVSLPAVLLLAARGLQVLRFNRLILAGTLVALLAISIPVVHAKLTKDMREDNRAALAALGPRFRKSDEVIFLSPGAREPFTYYLRQPVEHETVIEDAATADIDWPDGRRVWIFVRNAAADQLTKLLERMEVSYRRDEEWHFYGISEYLYVRRPQPPASGPRL